MCGGGVRLFLKDKPEATLLPLRELEFGKVDVGADALSGETRQMCESRTFFDLL